MKSEKKNAFSAAEWSRENDKVVRDCLRMYWILYRSWSKRQEVPVSSCPGVSGQTRNSFVRHEKMPLLMQRPSFVHIIWSWDSNGAEPGLFQHSLCNSVKSSPASPEQCVLVEEGLPQATPLVLPPSMLEKSHSLVVCFFNFFSLCPTVPVFPSTNATMRDWLGSPSPPRFLRWRYNPKVTVFGDRALKGVGQVQGGHKVS